MSIYLIVMAPICALEAFLLFNDSPAWMRWSASVVLGLSVYGFVHGNMRRLNVDEKGATWVTLFGKRQIPWTRVQSVSTYLPGGGLGATRYVYISMGQGEPAGRWVNDAETIQLQDREGLLQAIESARRKQFFPSDRQAG